MGNFIQYSGIWRICLQNTSLGDDSIFNGMQTLRLGQCFNKANIKFGLLSIHPLQGLARQKIQIQLGRSSKRDYLRPI